MGALSLFPLTLLAAAEGQSRCTWGAVKQSSWTKCIVLMEPESQDVALTELSQQSHVLAGH